MVDKKRLFPLQQIDGEEPASARDQGAAIIRHDREGTMPDDDLVQDVLMSKSRLSLAFVASLFLVTAGTAEPLTLEVASARADYDQRAKNPIIAIKLSGVSGQALRDFSQNNIGRKVELRVDGKPLPVTVIREPLIAGSLQISNNDFTAERTQTLAEQLSQPGIKVEVAIVPD